MRCALARDPIPIDFVPAPHERIAVAHGFVELRDGLERAVLDGIAYEPGGSPAGSHDHRAELWFGDAPYAHVATFAARRLARRRPARDPAVHERASSAARFRRRSRRARRARRRGRARAARRAARAHGSPRRTIAWADLGARVGSRGKRRLRVHAAMWQRIAPLGLGRLALAIAEALAPGRDACNATLRRRSAHEDPRVRRVTLAAGTVAADVSIIDNNKTITVDCAKDKSVNLIGDQLTVTLTGTCTRVQLSGNHETVTGSATTFWVAGNHNTVTADGTDEIQIAGNDNTLSWKKA